MRTLKMSKLITLTSLFTPLTAVAHPGHGLDAHLHGEMVIISLSMVVLALVIWKFRNTRR